jgi:predicted metalloendopeptidase
MQLLLTFHTLKIKIKSDTWMENIVELLSWDFMEKLSKWKMQNEFDWATSPTNVNAFHTFQANTISKQSAFILSRFINLKPLP